MARSLWAEKKLLTLEILLFILFVLAFKLVLGWKAALILTAVVLVHESGHIWAMRHFKLRLKAFLFIPMAGAVVVPAADKYPSENADGWVSLMGPLWGFGSALLALGLWRLTGAGIFHEATFYAIIINLFNLLPLYPVDGGRLMRCFTHMLSPTRGLLLFMLLNLVSLVSIALISWSIVEVAQQALLPWWLFGICVLSLAILVAAVIIGAYEEWRNRLLLVWYELTRTDEKKVILGAKIGADPASGLREKLFEAAAAYRYANNVKLNKKQLLALFAVYVALMASFVALLYWLMKF